jgi:NADPH-dependent 2,4-dienoyl-CoA reductase/sulfur reductase-like enzyme/rhodanese-related sulfurtransferase/two-component sensor histidine kinase
MADMERDIERYERELESYRETIERLYRERSEYLRVSAHQMKSPVATIQFGVDTLLGSYAGRLNSKQIRVVESIKNSVTNLQNLIMDILELERFRTGDIELEDIDFIEVSIDTIEVLREKLREKNIRFHSDIPNKVLVVSGNRSGLQHALYNLLENAVKYSQVEGEVLYTVSYNEKRKRLRAVVEDHGIGIPEDVREKVFEEFFRAQNARLFDKSGTGFGLAIVKRIVELCGGALHLDSAENEGTTVTVELPVKSARNTSGISGSEATSRRRILVIGGVAAGPKAASRARRLDPEARITLLEKGNFLAYAGCALPYYISGKLRNRRDLFKSYSGLENATEFFRNIKGIEIKNLSLALKIDRRNREVLYRDIPTGREHREPYDVLILATGSKPIIPEIAGIDLDNIFVLHGVDDSENIKSAIANELARDVVILGGGNIGVETAEALIDCGARVTVIERRREILPFLDHEMGALVRRHMEQHGVRVLTDVHIEEFRGEERVKAVRLRESEISTDMVILATGFRPEVSLAVEAGLAVGPTGAISINEYLQTNDESIYAAGDCTEVVHAVSDRPFYLPLGSTANRQGRVAGSNAAGQRLRFGRVNGTIIIHVFDIHIAKTGLNEGEAGDSGFDPVAVYVPDYDRDEFIPGAGMINIKLVADRETRRLLGVQIVGRGDVAKRIDVVSAVISRGGNVDDVTSLDLGYGPAYSQAIDSIVTAAHVMQNKLDGLFEGSTAFDVQSMIEVKKTCACIDVRPTQEYVEERIPGAESIPLESLRRRIDEIPRDQSILLISETGARAYQASLILKANGFESVRILEGGLRMWPFRLARE